jgi:hypothetical protein
MGANAVLYRVSEAHVTAIVLANTDTTDVDALARVISRVVVPPATPH